MKNIEINGMKLYTKHSDFHDIIWISYDENSEKRCGAVAYFRSSDKWTSVVCLEEGKPFYGSANTASESVNKMIQNANEYYK